MMSSHSVRPACSGFSLVEVALALLVVSVGLAAVFSLFPSGTDSNRRAIQDTQIGLFADYVLNGFRHEAETVPWDDVHDKDSSFSIPALCGIYAWSNPDPVYADREKIRSISYKAKSDPAIEEMAFSYQLRVFPVAGKTNNIKALVLNVWPSAYSARGPTNVFYTEVFNYGG